MVGGHAPTFTPDTAPVTLAVTRQGFDATGATASYADTLVVTKRVRQPYPNQATLTATTVSLSDYVYSTDTVVGVTTARPRPARSR
jgi:hypothetical protein